MKTLKIYNTRQAKKDLKANIITPLQASIEKWKSFYEALYAIQEEALQSCGLCETHSMCKGCALVDCTEIKKMKYANDSIRDTKFAILDFVNLMEELKP